MLILAAAFLLLDYSLRQDENAATAETKPGLLTTVQSVQGVAWRAIEPKVAGTWPDGHAPHPSIDSNGFKIRWEGLVRIPRAAKYRFSAIARGRFLLDVDGKPVLGVESPDASAGAGVDAVTLQGAWIPLEPGDLPLTAQFEKQGSPARIQLLWESEDFARVPVPATALGHAPRFETLEFGADLARERGQRLFEENRCVACHVRSDVREVEKGPDLTNVGTRMRGPWLLRWLDNPAAVRPGTSMPKMFADDAIGRAERMDVVRYLTQATPAEPPKPASKDRRIDAEAGKKAFAARGCVACHDLDVARAPRSSGDVAAVALQGIGSKYEPQALLAFLENPAASHPGGRMPNLNLDSRERENVAAYVTTVREDILDVSLDGSGDVAASIERGRAAVRSRCLSCHEIRGEVASQAGATALEAGLTNAGSLGCVGAAPPAPRAPVFAMTEGDRAALTAFLSTPSRVPASSSLTLDSKRTIAKFLCLQCHVHDGAGGGLADKQRRLLGEAGASSIEQVAPPELTGVGSKLRPEWLREMFDNGTRSRPWLQARMPHFGVAEVSRLADGFAALDGEELTLEPASKSLLTAAGLAGRDLVGRQGFNCVACHDLAGSEASVAFVDSRGPDLTLGPSRLRENWFRAWLVDPQALVPGTKMPTYFPGGESTLPGRHGLDTEGQIRALYDYFGLGKEAPLPAGLGNDKGWSWVAGGAPVLLRTPLDNAPRSICVGFPGGASFAFDAERGQLHAWWHGGFLRMDGTQWTGNHGPYPEPEGKALWKTQPDTQPFLLTKPGDEPGPSLLTTPPKFLGYTLADGNPTYRTAWTLPDGKTLTVQERYILWASESGLPEGCRLDRRVNIHGIPAGLDLWVFVTQTDHYAGSFQMAITDESGGGAGGIRSSSSHPTPGVPVNIQGRDMPVGTSLATTPHSEGTRVWFRFAAAPKDRDLEFSYSLTYGAAGRVKQVLPEKGAAAAGVDAFEAAPRVAATRDGVEVKGKNPFALEGKAYKIDTVPVPSEIVLQGGGLDFLPNGSLAVCTRRGEVWLLENATKDASQHRWKRFAQGLHEPLGLKVVGETIYVMQKPEITKLVDNDQDGVCDEYVSVNSEWGLSTNFHEFGFGLEHDKDGNFYGTLGLAIIPGGATRPEQVFARGSAFRVDKNGKFDVLGLGARTPNGTGLGADGEFYYTDNQGDYVPACKLTQVKPGEFYGQRFALTDREAKVDVVPPVCWFPYGTVSQSATDVLLEDRGGKFGPFTGQLLVGELTNSQILRVQLETVRGKQQGTCWIFRRGFASGVNRLCFGPDDALYVAETTGGWGARGAKLFALEKVSFSGAVPFEMKSVHLTKEGFEIEFTKPVNVEKRPAAADVSVEQFRYHYWSTYGSPEVDRKAVKVTDVALSAEGKTLTIAAPGLVKERICEIRLRGITSADGEPLVHAECWYTLNEFPE